MTLAELWRTPGIKTLIITALASAVFTIGIFLYSLDQKDERVVGTVVRVTPEAIVIVEPRGNELTLLISPETKVRALGPLNDLELGTLVMGSGERTSSTTIAAFGIRRVDERLGRDPRD